MIDILIITFSKLINVLIALGYLISGVLILMILWRIFSWVYETIFLGFMAPLLGHRAYFYKYLTGEIFYSERFLRFLYFFKLGRNKKWAIHHSLVGYVKKPFWVGSEKNVNIYSVAHGKSQPVAYACFEHDKNNNIKKANIFLVHYFADGSSKPDTENPIGYVDESGDIYKYYEDYNFYKRRKKLENAEKIGTCCNISKDSSEFFETDGCYEDSEALKFIKGANEEEVNDLAAKRDSNLIIFAVLRDKWYSIRKNFPKNKKVKAILFDSTSRNDKRRWIDLLIWRFINVVPLLWSVRAKAFGYGFSKENFNWGKSSHLETESTKGETKQKGIPLNFIGCAALLLLENQGFLLYEDGPEKEEKPGLAETALISLLLYFLFYKAVAEAAENGFLSAVFPFIGPEISTVVMMLLIFFVLWWAIHFLYNHILDRPPYLKQLLNMLNSNTGIKPFMSAIIIFSIIGLILTITHLPYTLSAFFISTLIAVSVNLLRFPHRKWEIINPLDEENTSEPWENDENDPLENLVTREYQWNTNNSFRNFQCMFTLKFDPQQIDALRKLNPFSTDLTTSNYSEIAGKMTEKEIDLSLDKELDQEIIPSLSLIKSKFDKIVVANKLNKIEKITLVLNFVQEAIKYCIDTESETLINAGLNKEYCRYSRETLYDMEGDCDCKSELAATLLASYGYRVGYFTTQNHAFIGISAKELGYLDNDFFNDAFVEVNKEKFLYCETTVSGWLIGMVPNEFKNDDIENYYVING